MATDLAVLDEAVRRAWPSFANQPWLWAPFDNQLLRKGMEACNIDLDIRAEYRRLLAKTARAPNQHFLT